MNRGMKWMILVAVMSMAASALAESSPWTYRASVGLGHDSNVLREATQRDSGTYIPVSAYVDYKTPLSPKARLWLGGRLVGDKYSSDNSKGDELIVDLDARYDRRLTGGKRGIVKAHSLDLQLTGRLEKRNTNYMSRSLGEEISAPGENGSVLLTDRYDANKAQGALSLTYRLFRSTRLEGRYETTRRNYINDYEMVPTVDSLDYTNWNLRFRILQKLSDVLDVELSYKNSHTDYDEWRARDLDGNKVEGEFQSFRYLTWAGVVDFQPTEKFDFSVEIHQRDREDPFQGYYDYSQWGMQPRVKIQATEKISLDVRYSYIHRTYDRARVGFNPVKDLREDTEDRFFIKAVMDVSENGSVFMKFKNYNNEEANPLYTYDRQLFSAGYQVSY